MLKISYKTSRNSILKVCETTLYNAKLRETTQNYSKLRETMKTLLKQLWSFRFWYNFYRIRPYNNYIVKKYKLYKHTILFHEIQFKLILCSILAPKYYIRVPVCTVDENNKINAHLFCVFVHGGLIRVYKTKKLVLPIFKFWLQNTILEFLFAQWTKTQ